MICRNGNKYYSVFFVRGQIVDTIRIRNSKLDTVRNDYVWYAFTIYVHDAFDRHPFFIGQVGIQYAVDECFSKKLINGAAYDSYFIRSEEHTAELQSRDN